MHNQANSVAAETRKVVESYFHAWTQKRPADAYAVLADDLHFVGPTAAYERAEDFRIPLQKFSEMTRSAKIIAFLVDDDRAAILYDCELPPPLGMTRIASFFQVRNGKIVWYETQFDATELRKLQPSKQ